MQCLFCVEDTERAVPGHLDGNVLGMTTADVEQQRTIGIKFPLVVVHHRRSAELLRRLIHGGSLHLVDGLGLRFAGVGHHLFLGCRRNRLLNRVIKELALHFELLLVGQFRDVANLSLGGRDRLTIFGFYRSRGDGGIG